MCDAGGVVVVVVDVVRHPAVISHSLFSSAVIETLQRLQLLHRSAVWHGHCHLQANYANEQFSQIHCRLSLSRRPRCCHLWANLTPTRVVGQIRLSNRIPSIKMRMLTRLKWPLSHLIGAGPRCCHLWANLTPTRVVGQIRLSNRIPSTRMRMLMRLKWPLSHLIGLRPDEMII